MAPALRMTHVTKASYKFFFESSPFNSGHSLIDEHIHLCKAQVNTKSFLFFIFNHLTIIFELVDNTHTLCLCHICSFVKTAAIVRIAVDLASLQKTTHYCC
jgi:hypothetical protein